MSKFFLFLTLCFSFNSLASIDRSVGCFSSDVNKVNVKFVEIYDNEIPLSYVEHKNSKKSISLVFFKKSEESVSEGRPAEITTKWKEVINGNINGEYTVVSQGANYYNFIYEGNNGKKVSMNENSDAYNDDHSDCIWK